MSKTTRSSNIENLTSCYIVVPGANVLTPTPVVLRCDVSGTATIVGEDGVSTAHNLLQGERVPLQGQIKVTAAMATLIAYH